MALFHPFRALGVVSTDVPFAVQRRGRATFLTVSAGKAWQLYNCAKLTLIFVGQPLERNITALAAKGDYTFAAYGAHVAVFKRAHRVGTWRGAGGEVVALLPLGDLVLALSTDGRLTPWRVEEYDAPAFPPAPLPPGFTPTCVCHPDAYVNKALLGSSDGRLALVNFAAATLVHTFAGFGAAVRCLAPSPALDCVAVGLADGTVHVHNVRFDAPVVAFTHDAAGGAVTACSFRTGPGPALLACGGVSGAITVWDLAAKRLHTVLKEAHDEALTHTQVVSLHFFAGEPLLMSAGGDNALKQWLFDADDGSARLLRFRSGHAAPPVALRFYGGADSNVPQRLLSGGADRAFRVFSTIQDQQSAELSQRNIGARAKKLRISEAELKLPAVTALAHCQLRERDWCNVLTAHADAASAYAWRLAQGALGEHVLTPPRSGGAPVTAVAVSACGHYALVATACGDVDRFNLQSGLHRGGFVRRPEDEAAREWGGQAGWEGWVAPTTAQRRAAQAAAGGIAAPKPGKAAGMWALAGPKREKDEGRPAHDGLVTFVDADARNSSVITAGADGVLRLWAFAGRRLTSACRVGAPVERGVLHRGASLAALACDDARVRVFDTAAQPPRRVRCFSGHGDAVTDLTFSSDARWLLTSSLDGALRVFDVPAGRLLQSLRLGGSPITALALSCDSGLLATAHGGKRGIYLFANRLVYSAGGEADLAPPPEEGAPPLDVRAPGVGDGLAGAGADGAIWGEDSPGDADGAPRAGEARLVEAEGEEEEEEAAPRAKAKEPSALAALPPLPQVAPQLVTLALLPRAQWLSLLQADAVRERGRPEQPAAAPASAPFFLPTLPGLATQPVFDIASTPAEPGSRVLRNGGSITDGGAAASRSPLLRAIAAHDPAAALAHLAASSASSLDAELRSLTLASPDAEHLAPGDVDAVDALLAFFLAQLPAGRAFELLHAALGATLRVHGDAIAATPQLRLRAAELRDVAAGAWTSLDARFQEARCVLAFLAGLSQA